MLPLKRLSTPLIVIGGLTTSYLLYKTLKIYLNIRKYKHIPGPPTKGIIGFYLGNIPEISEAISKGKITGDMLVKWQAIYGNTFKFRMFGQTIVVTCDQETIKEIMIIKSYPKTDETSSWIGFPLGESVLQTFVGHFDQIVNNLSDKLRTMADGKTVVNLFKEINRATLDAIAMIAFGMNTDAVNQEDCVLNAYLSFTLQTLMIILFDPLMKIKPWKFGEVRKFKKTIRHLRQIGRERIQERINAFKNNEHMPDDILSSILSSYKGENLELETMVDDFVTFFLAGQETTANALAFCFLEMCKKPEIIEKARNEIDRVLGERTEITFQDIPELKYCSAVFKETLRLFPPASLFDRKLTEKRHLGGFDIPPNTPIWMSTYMNSRNEKFFKNALEFRPERFIKSVSSNDDYDSIENYTYMPFGLGARNCIGQNFAQLEGVIVIAKMLQNFDFKLDPSQSFVIEHALTLRPKAGTKCFLTIRS